MCALPQIGKSTLQRRSPLASRGTRVAGHGSRITRHSSLALCTLPQKLIATRLLNTDVNDRKQTTATHVNRYYFRGIWRATKPKTPQRGFTLRQSPNLTHATETQTMPAGAQQNIPNHVRRDKDETRVPRPAPAGLSSRATRRSILPRSNRKSWKLEATLTCRKQSTTLRSNREKMQGSHQSRVNIAVRLLLLDTPSGTVCTGFDQGCKDRARKPFLAVIQ